MNRQAYQFLKREANQCDPVNEKRWDGNDQKGEKAVGDFQFM